MKLRSRGILVPFGARCQLGGGGEKGGRGGYKAGGKSASEIPGHLFTIYDSALVKKTLELYVPSALPCQYPWGGGGMAF